MIQYINKSPKYVHEALLQVRYIVYLSCTDIVSLSVTTTNNGDYLYLC